MASADDKPMRRVKAPTVPTRRPASAARGLPLGQAQRAARTAYTELAETGSLHLNVLLVASDPTIACLLDSVRPHLRHPICFWRADQPFVLPPPSCAGTLILRNIRAMSPDQQATLFDWLNEVGDTQVVSTASAPVWPEVQHGRFMAALYYRLNTIVIDVA